MTSENYAFIYRPTWEWAAVTSWLIAAAAAGVLIAHAVLPATPLYAAAALSVGMAACRGHSAWRHRRHKSALQGHGISFISLDDLSAQLERAPDELFLGYGFDWHQRHCQRVHDILWHDEARTVGPREGIGARWIHGVEPSEDRVALPLSDLYGHLLLTGTTRAGKGVTLKLIIAQAILRQESVIVIDPKGDTALRDTMKAACDYIGRPDRYVYFHPGFAEESVRIDPLRNFLRGSELASRIAALIPSETGADPFTAFGQMSLTNVVNGMLYTHRHPSLATMRRYLEGGVESLVLDALTAYCTEHVAYWEERAQPYLRKARNTREKALSMARFYRAEVADEVPSSDIDGLLSLFEHDREHFQKMVASLLPILSMLTSGQIGPLMSPDTTDLDDPRPITDTARIIRNRQAAYIGLDSLTDGMVAGALGSILLSDLTAVAGDRYNYGVDLNPVNVVVDEASEAINDPFVQLLNKSGGARLRLYVATQTFADFADKAGSQDKARKILGNLNNKITLRTIDGDTQQYITDGLPETRARYIMRTQSANVNPDSPAEFSGGAGERLMEETVPMFPKQLLGALPNWEYIAQSGARLAKGRVPILDTESQAGG